MRGSARDLGIGAGWVWTVILAVVLSWVGGLADGGEGAFFGFALGWFAGWIYTVQRRSAYLRDVVTRLERRLRHLESGEMQTQAPAIETENAPIERSVSDGVPHFESDPVDVSPARTDFRESLPPPPSTPGIFQRSAEPNPLLAGIRELLFGGNTVVRAGILVLLVGVSMLVKWAADNSIVPLEVRLLGAATLGVLLMAVGYRLRNLRPGFATTLQGGGVATLYLVVFAAFRLFELISASSAFIAFALIALVCGSLAVLQRSQALMIIGSLGGFLAPVLTSTGTGSHISLFGYYVVLNIAIATVAWFQQWRLLNLIAFICTYGVATIWGVLKYRPDQLSTTEPFLIAFFLLFTATALLFAWRRPPRLRGIVDGTLIFGTPLLTFLAQGRLVGNTEYGLAISAAVLALFYAGTTYWLWNRASNSLRPLAEAFLALAIGFGTMAVPFTFEGSMTTAIAWALEGAGLYWVGLRQARRLPRWSGILLQGLAACALILMYQRSRALLPFLNGPWLSFVALAGSGGFIGFRAWNALSMLPDLERLASRVLTCVSVGWLLIGIFAEINRFVPFAEQVAVKVVVLGLLGLGLEWGGGQLKWPLLRTLSFSVLPGALLLFAHAAETQTYLFAHGGGFAWPFVLVAIYLVLYRIQETDHRWLGYAYCGAAWLFALVIPYGIGSSVDVRLRTTGDWVVASVALAFSGIVTALCWQRVRHWAATPLISGLGPLVIIGAIGTLMIQFLAHGETAPLSYVPILNPADLASMALLGAFAYWGQLARGEVEAEFDPRYRPFALYVWGALAFACFNGMLVRTVVQWTDVRFSVDALWDSVALQVATSISWTMIALVGVIYASKRSARHLWMVGAGLLAVVVFKLFFVDLEQLSTVAKIGTFLVVGTLLLIVGYLSPAPPAAAIESEH